MLQQRLHFAFEGSRLRLRDQRGCRLRDGFDFTCHGISPMKLALDARCRALLLDCIIAAFASLYMV